MEDCPNCGKEIDVASEFRELDESYTEMTCLYCGHILAIEKVVYFVVADTKNEG